MVTCYAVFGCYFWKAWAFLREIGGVNPNGELGEGMRGETVVRMSYMREEYIFFF